MIGSDTYHDPQIARRFLAGIDALVADAVRPLMLMEVCGTHTMAIYQYGLRGLLPERIRLISGPGCPVCVTPVGYIDQAVAISRLPDVTITTFGDLVRVPGSSTSLLEEQARGADIRIVYSPLDAVTLAQKNPEKQVVFLGVGFETTTPTVAGALVRAEQLQLRNFSVLCAHKTMPAPMAALTADEELQVDGYLCPAHVSAIIGADAFLPLAEEYRIPCVVTGFEPLDILQGVEMLVRQILRNESRVENQYRRFVRASGNLKAQQLSAQLFEPCDAVWRGIGMIAGSGLRINRDFADFDACRRFDVVVEEPREPEGCLCGEILKGKKTPRQCPLFGQACTPESPIGACMVSSEGTCAAEYKYAC